MGFTTTPIRILESSDGRLKSAPVQAAGSPMPEVQRLRKVPSKGEAMMIPLEVTGEPFPIMETGAVILILSLLVAAGWLFYLYR
ncbi:hypothetical protein C499_18109 [Halogeometricum borinquense DSM 11551]|uniref:Uncharacterized protein n=2 Tax=Halogeometricum borinquense (strain ATCC 700274 / DSM 11551 / JCM 10706 / KCTC 4070 / PR3) TaxID=469382 RepID=L9UGC4_HALBP|nr:hypothetical protein C499_18109 [Halogeometricum borinquense DSM 11551]